MTDKKPYHIWQKPPVRKELKWWLKWYFSPAYRRQVRALLWEIPEAVREWRISRGMVNDADVNAWEGELRG